MLEVAGRRGRYRVEDEIGQGGMGVVYRARRVETNELVAIKILRTPWPDPDLRRRFEEELRLGEAVRHECLVPVLDHGHDAAGRAFIAMPFVAGETLQARLQGGPMPWRQAARVAARLARGLAEAHRRGIVHRDVKPANVILGPDGVPRLTDFGLALDMTRDQRLTMEGEIVGTPAYMSPEQVAGARVDGRSDVHSVGVILYAMLTGRLPYEGASEQETFQAVVYGVAPPPSRAAPGRELPAALDQVVGRALAKRPDERFRTADDLAAALEAAIAAPTAAPRSSAGKRIALGLGAAAAIGAGVALSFAIPAAPPSAPPPPPPPAAPPADQEATRLLATCRERQRRGEPAASVIADLERCARLVPTLADAHLELSRARAALGDLVEARRALEAASSLVSRAPRETAALEATARRELTDEALAQQRLLEVAASEELAFRTRSALTGLADALKARPRSARLRREHARMLAWHGRAREALAEADEARRLDPALEPPFDEPARRSLQLAAQVSEAESLVPPPADAWEAFLGGAWIQRDDELLGAGQGVGPFSFGSLIRADVPALERYKLSVEVCLETSRSGACAYAGIVFAARDPDDYYCLYLYDHEAEFVRALGPDAVSAFQKKWRCRPKGVRLARIVRGEWEIRGDDEVLPLPDEDFVALAATVAENRLTLEVGGKSWSVDLDRKLDGRVGVLKFYDTAVRFRAWSVTRD